MLVKASQIWPCKHDNHECCFIMAQLPVTFTFRVKLLRSHGPPTGHWCLKIVTIYLFNKLLVWICKTVLQFFHHRQSLEDNLVLLYCNSKWFCFYVYNSAHPQMRKLDFNSKCHTNIKTCISHGGKRKPTLSSLNRYNSDGIMMKLNIFSRAKKENSYNFNLNNFSRITKFVYFR